MSRPDPRQVNFHDAAGCFSEEEWKLLDEWQKDLYRNVMKEIHQALISLGPLIATTISSLRAKEKEELCHIDHQGSERRHGIHHSPSDVIANPDVLFEINDEETLHLINPQDTEERHVHDCLSAGFPFLNRDICLRKEEEPVSIFIDHLGAEVRESSTDSISDAVATAVVSFCIKDEEETYSIDQQNSKRIDGISSPTGETTIKRKCNMGESVTSAGQTTSCKSSSVEAKVKVLQSCEVGTHYGSQLWSDIIQELGEEETTQREIDFNNQPHFILNPGTHKVERSEKCTNWETNLGLTNLLTSQANIQHSWRLYSCIDCEKSFNKKEYLIRHRRTHMGVKPYQCAECEKTFRKKEYLVVHKRTHTGEKPYHCTRCEKRFSQKGVLNRHQRTHGTTNVENYPSVP